jgi:GNAT superfamily N-acetyltransferase
MTPASVAGRRLMAARSRSNPGLRGRSSRPNILRIGVRPAALQDLSTLIRHRVAMERELGRGGRKGLVPFVRAYRRWMVAGIRSHHFIPFVATDGDGRPIGSGSIWLREDRPHRGNLSVRIPRIHGIYVEPAARRRGVATGLLRSMLRWVRRHGYRRVVLQTTAKAKALYSRYGFKPKSEMERTWSN